jgi:hypothetical protein
MECGFCGAKHAGANEPGACVKYWQEQCDDLVARLQFVLDRTPAEDGVYTFPDGVTYDAGKLAS